MTARPRRLARILAALVVTWSLAAPAQEGRYQAVPIDGGVEYGTEKALILDTVAGHLWIWVESPAVNDEPGGRYLIYQGQLEPGKTMGQVMDRQEWRSSAPPPGD
ncbi:MAG: hypothetical protein AB7Q81_16180 [Gammaproteobacteria bacterium]